MRQELMELASSIEVLSIEIESLNDLLQLYAEHREDELGGVSLEKPHTVISMLARQNLGASLLGAVADKASHIQKLSEDITKRGYGLAKTTPGSVNV